MNIIYKSINSFVNTFNVKIKFKRKSNYIN